jgi:hypothetical protein
MQLARGTRGSGNDCRTTTRSNVARQEFDASDIILVHLAGTRIVYATRARQAWRRGPREPGMSESSVSAIKRGFSGGGDTV